MTLNSQAQQCGFGAGSQRHSLFSGDSQVSLGLIRTVCWLQVEPSGAPQALGPKAP